ILLCRIGPPAGSAYHFFIVTTVIRNKTLAAARWALLLIVRAFFNDAITVALWTGLHVRLPVDTSASLSRTTRFCLTHIAIGRAETVTRDAENNSMFLRKAGQGFSHLLWQVR